VDAGVMGGGYEKGRGKGRGKGKGKSQDKGKSKAKGYQAKEDAAPAAPAPVATAVPAQERRPTRSTWAQEESQLLLMTSGSLSEKWPRVLEFSMKPLDPEWRDMVSEKMAPESLDFRVVIPAEYPPRRPFQDPHPSPALLAGTDPAWGKLPRSFASVAAALFGETFGKPPSDWPDRALCFAIKFLERHLVGAFRACSTQPRFEAPTPPGAVQTLAVAADRGHIVLPATPVSREPSTTEQEVAAPQESSPRSCSAAATPPAASVVSRAQSVGSGAGVSDLRSVISAEDYQAEADEWESSDEADSEVLPWGMRAEVNFDGSVAPDESSTTSESEPDEDDEDQEEQEWTQVQQEALEEAMRRYPAGGDVHQRWRSIAEAVGRPVHQCMEQFRAGRAAALRAMRAPALAAQGQTVETVRRTGVEVRLTDVKLIGVGTVVPVEIQFQVICSRCKRPGDITTRRGTDANGELLKGGRPCEICRQEQVIYVAPGVIHASSNTVGTIVGELCHPYEMVTSDCWVSCFACGSTSLARSVGAGFAKSSECGACFRTTRFSVEAATILGPAAALWRRVAAGEAERTAARAAARERRAQEGIVGGTPLPKQGTCKHYGKSYRWFRFPCCKKAYPCEKCHDEVADHEVEWANRMICGYCSKEQIFSNKPCMGCGAAQFKARTSHWEGGKGTRDQTVMSRNDKQKYSGMNKTLSKKQKAKK